MTLALLAVLAGLIVAVPFAVSAARSEPCPACQSDAHCLVHGRRR